MRTLACLLAISGAAAADVSGTLRYQDRVYTTAGFTGAQPYLPIRQAEVEIVTTAAPQTVVASAVTDDTGAYSASPLVPIPNTSVFLRVYARRSIGPVNAVVRNNPTANAVYTVASTAVLTDGSGDATLDLDVTIAGGGASAFNIFDCAVRSFQYQASITASPPLLLPVLTVYWQAGVAEGTYFDNTTNAIYLLGGAADPDEYDDDIVLHEMGHWVAFNFSKDDTLGGPHSIVDQLDPRTAWSEGWAHYWSAAVRRAFGYASPSFIVDTFAASNSFFDLELPSAPAQTVMATNEVAVAAVLWDLTDPSNEAFDLVSGSSTADGTEVDLWEAVDTFLAGRANVTLEDFREGLAVEAAALIPLVTGTESVVRLMNNRSIRYYPDGLEANDTPAAATPLGLGSAGFAQRTFFVAGDEDWYEVTVGGEGTLEAETFNLGDGANTLLEVYGSDGSTLLTSNDDRALSNRSSAIFLPVGGPGTYFLRVRRSGDIVENGYYDLAARLGPPVDPPVAGYCGAAVPPLPGGAFAAAGLAGLLGILACFRRRS